MCLVSFMHKLCQVFAEYFKEVEEESIRDNFVIVYELLDEVMDYGSPQFTDSKVYQIIRNLNPIKYFRFYKNISPKKVIN